MIGDSKQRPHQRLEVWQDAMDLVVMIYAVTAEFPDHERFGLTAQMRKAAISVPSNIAEGAARSSRSELHHYLSIARGSLSELDTQLDIAIRLSFTQASPVLHETLNRTFAKLNALMRRLARRADESPVTNHQSRQSHAR